MKFLIRIVAPFVAALFFVIAILGVSQAAFGQTTGVLMPSIPPTFFNASGLVASNAKLCSTTSGTSTSLATFSDSALSSPLPNPITLSAVGVPQTSGGASTSVYLTPGRNYRFTLYAAGTGNTCNGSAVGAQIWQRDNVYDYAALSSFANIQLCDRFLGANAGAKIAACIAALPSTGGTADARGIQGAQVWTSNPFSGVVKPVSLMLGAATHASSVSVTVPSNVTLDFSQGGILSMASATTATINGGVQGTLSQHFAGSGSVVFGSPGPPDVFPEWFGAARDGTTDDTAAFNKAITSAVENRSIRLAQGSYLWTSTVTIPGDRLHFVGAGNNATKIIFTPTANDVALEITKPTAAVINEGSVKGIGFYSADATYAKTAIRSVDVSNYAFEDIVVGGGVVAASGNSVVWSGGTGSGGSIAFQTSGREAVSAKRFRLYADRPIYIADNPNSTIDADHYRFEDMYLVANDRPVIEVQDNAYVQHLLFDGYQAWAAGTDGFRYESSVATGARPMLSFNNVGREQVESTGAYLFYLDMSGGSSVQNLTINNAYGPTINEGNGLFLRGITGGSINNFFYIGNGTSLNASSTVTALNFWNRNWEANGGTMSISGFTSFCDFNNTGKYSCGTFDKTAYWTVPNASYFGSLTSGGSAVNLIGYNAGNYTDISPSGVTTIIGGNTGGLMVGMTHPVSHKINMPNNACLGGGNVAGNNTICIINIDGNDDVHIARNGEPIIMGGPVQLGTPITLGGGTAATLGTIGGSGPATATQSIWGSIRMNNGQTYYFPLFQVVWTLPGSGLMYWLWSRRRRRPSEDEARAHSRYQQQQR